MLFFADERFKFKNLCFESAYVVIHNTFKQGVGAINIEMKNLLEKKDLKINLPRESASFKLTITKENDIFIPKYNKTISSKFMTTVEETVQNTVEKNTLGN